MIWSTLNLIWNMCAVLGAFSICLTIWMLIRISWCAAIDFRETESGDSNNAT